MSGALQEPGNPEYGLSPDQLSAYSQACHSGACADFRASVLDKLQQAGAIHQGEGWALFQIGDEEEIGANRETLQAPTKQVLLHTICPTEGPTIEGQLIPVVRLLTKEVIVAADKVREYLVTDFTLDHGNNTLYSVDATNFRNGLSSNRLLALTFGTDERGQLAFNRRPAEMFTKVQKAACLRSGQLLTDSTITVNEARVGVATFELFGNRSSQAARNDALAHGRRVMAEIVELQPAVTKRLTDT